MEKVFVDSMIGNRIGNWKVISNKFIRRWGRYYIHVKCTCGSNIEEYIPKSHIDKSNIGCCKCSRFHTSKGYELISGEFWSLIKSGATKRNIEFNITIKEAWDLYLKQDRRCALTNLSIDFEEVCTHTKEPNTVNNRTASLDRINSDLGYILPNIQWVHKDINIMKNRYSQDYFIKMCKLICQNKKN